MAALIRPCSDYAPLWRRLAAGLYDALLLLAIWICGGMIVVAIRGSAVPPLSVWFELYLAALAFGYFGVSWIKGGQTLGMRAWRIRVMREDGAALDWPTALLRFAVAIPSTALALIGWLYCLIDPRRRALHDVAAACVMVKTDPKPAAAR